MDLRFGRVYSDNPVRDIWVSNFWVLGYFAVSFLDDLYLAGTGWPSARFLFVGGAAVWCSARLWPYSVHYLVVAAITFGFALTFVEVRGEEALELWQLKAFATALLAWGAAGVVDLALLFKVLPHQPHECEGVDAT